MSEPGGRIPGIDQPRMFAPPPAVTPAEQMEVSLARIVVLLTEIRDALVPPPPDETGYAP